MLGTFFTPSSTPRKDHCERVLAAFTEVLTPSDLILEKVAYEKIKEKVPRNFIRMPQYISKAKTAPQLLCRDAALLPNTIMRLPKMLSAR